MISFVYFSSCVVICLHYLTYISQIQGLEKYVMTKLFTGVYASVPEEVNEDDLLHEKVSLIQQFIRPENLDIQPIYQNETSWLVSVISSILVNVSLFLAYYKILPRHIIERALVCRFFLLISPYIANVL